MDSNRDHLVKFMIEKFQSSSCVFAEIGVWTGTFSSRVLREVNIKEAHLIDPWVYSKTLSVYSLPDKPYCIDVDFEKVHNQEHLDKIYKAVLSLFSIDGRVRVYRQTSAEAVVNFNNQYFDWIYIDGDHSQEVVEQDLTSWFTKLKKNGFISGDDYDWGKEFGHPVQKAVNSFLASNKNAKLLSKTNGQWLIQKTS